MERGKLIVTTEVPEVLKRIKIAALLGSIAIAGLLIYSSLAAENITPQSLFFSVVIGVALVIIGIVNYRRPESFGAAYEHVFVGRAARENGSKTDPFELRYEQITELRLFNKRDMEKNLLICTEQTQYRIFCRENQQELIAVLASKINPPETAEEE